MARLLETSGNTRVTKPSEGGGEFFAGHVRQWPQNELPIEHSRVGDCQGPISTGVYGVRQYDLLCLRLRFAAKAEAEAEAEAKGQNVKIDRPWRVSPEVVSPEGGFYLLQ